jgi:hypothetical protein
MRELLTGTRQFSTPFVRELVSISKQHQRLKTLAMAPIGASRAVLIGKPEDKGLLTF